MRCCYSTSIIFTFFFSILLVSFIHRQSIWIISILRTLPFASMLSWWNIDCIDMKFYILLSKLCLEREASWVLKSKWSQERNDPLKKIMKTWFFVFLNNELTLSYMAMMMMMRYDRILFLLSSFRVHSIHIIRNIKKSLLSSREKGCDEKGYSLLATNNFIQMRTMKICYIKYLHEQICSFL